MSNSGTRQRFTQQFKDDAGRLVIEHGYSCEETGRRLGVSANNISRWVRQYRNKLEDPTESGLSREQLEIELKRLRKENRRLEMEREILKKATVSSTSQRNTIFKFLCWRLIPQSFSGPLI
jgi:transposase